MPPGITSQAIGHGKAAATAAGGLQKDTLGTAGKAAKGGG